MKRILFVIFAAVILFTACVPAFAALTNGSISVVMVNKADKKPVYGKTVTSVKVADCDYENGNYTFALTDAFASTEAELTDTDAASVLYQAFKTSGKNGINISSDKEGIAFFADCVPGAYLVFSSDNLFNPFLVFIPMDDGNYYVFDVTAEPKIDFKPEEGTTEPVTDDEETTTRTTPTGNGGSSYITPPLTPGQVSPGGGKSSNPPSGQVFSPRGSSQTGEKSDSISPEKLAQTGMLQYPVPILGISGMILFAAGFIIYGEGRKKQREN